MESARLSTLSKEALALHARVSGAREKIPSVCLKIGQMWRKAPCFGLPLRYASNTQSPTILDLFPLHGRVHVDRSGGWGLSKAAYTEYTPRIILL